MASVGDDDAGFTLIELLMVLVILPLIMGAVATVIITTLQDSVGVGGRVSDSADTSIISANYVHDVQSAALVTTDPAVTSPTLCAAPAPTGWTLLLGMQWSTSTAGPATTVSYWDVPTTVPVPTASTGVETELVREICVNGSTPSREVLSQDVSSSTSLPVVSGLPSTAPAGWVSSSGVSSITLSSSQPASGYTLELVAVPRVWTASGASGRPS
jgi:prepilin-type N-terminal cleavage/methylation domain-containing protein